MGANPVSTLPQVVTFSFVRSMLLKFIELEI